jgi:plastocyanin
MPGLSAVLRACVGALALAGVASSRANTFSVSPNTNSGNPATYKWLVSIDGGTATNNPTLTVLTGQSYEFHVSNVAFHPFWIDQSSGIGGTNPFPKGAQLSNNDVTSNSTITMSLAADAPNTLYYACGFHSSMIGTITVVHDLILRNGFD